MTITVIGSLNKDLVTRTSRIPSAGETLLASSFETGSGGKGANQAVACARLADRRGSRRRQHQEHHQQQLQFQNQQEQRQQQQEYDADISDETQQDLTIKMVGAVGDDGFGHDLIDGLAINGVDVSGVQIQEGGQTGVAVILVDDDSGENRILLSPNNANYSLTPADFETLPDPRPDLIILQLEIPVETVCRVIELAKAERVPVLLNPAPAPEGGLPREVYSGLTHLILNESEARILRRGLKNGEEEEETKEEEQDNPAQTAKRFLNLGVENVVITLGAQGAYYASAIQSQSQSQSQFSSQTTPANTPAGLQPILSDPSGSLIKAVDTTGAGDTFVGAYAVKVCEEKLHGDGSVNILQAVQWANLAASRSVLKEGAQAAMPWREEIDG